MILLLLQLVVVALRLVDMAVRGVLGSILGKRR